MNVGVEFRRNLFDCIDQVSNELGLGHIQMTVPSFSNSADVRSRLDGYSVIVHSNLLNTMGENDFHLLSEAASIIKRLSPLKVIEHFTLFCRNGLKQAVAMPDAENVSAGIELSCQNLKKWSSILDVSVALENAPIVENAVSYFLMLRDVTKLSGCEVTLDIPHLVMSLWSVAENERNFLLSLVKTLPITQIHIAGISFKEGVLSDEHHLGNVHMVIEFAKRHFPNVNDWTIEQAPGTSIKTIASAVKKIKTPGARAAEDDILDLLARNKIKSKSLNEINSELRADGISDFGKNLVPIFDRRESIFSSRGPLGILNLFLPFFYPVESMIQNFKDHGDEKALLKSSVSLVKWALSFYSWFDEQGTGINIFYGQGDKIIFRSSIDSNFGHGDQRELSSSGNLYIGNTNGSWVQVQYPLTTGEIYG